MKLRISLIFAVLLFGIALHSCSNDDETPVDEVATEDTSDDESENEDGGSDDDTEGDDNGDTSNDEEGEGDSEDENDSEGDGSSDGDGEDSSDDEGDNDEEDNEDGNDSGDGGNGSGDGSEDEDNGEGNGDDGSSENTPPSVVFNAPQNGQIFEEGSDVMVNAEVTDDSNVAFAQLFLNGTLVRQENIAPYEWGGTNQNDPALNNLGPGDYELIVVAEDEFGNTNENAITITVEANTEDEDDGTGNGDDNDQEGITSCDNPENAVFIENNGLVVAEFENNRFNGDWQFGTNEPNFSGEGYQVWTGTQHFNDPGNGMVRFRIRIQNPGTYRFVWRSAVTIGNSSSEHNDTWLRFPDADDFFGRRGGSIVFPRGTGKTPNPNGSSSEGWFKVYRSGNDLGFRWQSSTSDNDAHDIFVTFNAPGVYTMEISARSSGHAVDKFVLFNEDDFSFNEATSANNPLSEVDCN